MLLGNHSQNNTSLIVSELQLHSFRWPFKKA